MTEMSTDEYLDKNEDASNLVSRKRRMLKKAPDAPKRFKSAYICFVMEKMDSLKQQLPSDLKVTEIMKRLAYMWRTLPPLERREYELVAEADKARYFEELAGYSGPMQVPNKRQKKDPCAPKRAMSAFLSFSQMMRPQIRSMYPDLKNTDVSGVLAQHWKCAKEEARRPHLEREVRERQKYHEDMARWKAGEEGRVKDELDEKRERLRSTIDFLDLPADMAWEDSHSGSDSSPVSEMAPEEESFQEFFDPVKREPSASGARSASMSSGSTSMSTSLSSSMSSTSGTSGISGTTSVENTSDATSSCSSTAGSAVKTRTKEHHKEHTHKEHTHHKQHLHKDKHASVLKDSTSGTDSGTDSTSDRQNGSDSGNGSGSSSGLSDKVHMGLTAFVSFMDDQEEEEIAAEAAEAAQTRVRKKGRRRSDGGGRGAEIKIKAEVVPRVSVDAHTHGVDSSSVQGQMQGQGQVQAQGKAQAQARQQQAQQQMQQQAQQQMQQQAQQQQAQAQQQMQQSQQAQQQSQQQQAQQAQAQEEKFPSFPSYQSLQQGARDWSASAMGGMGQIGGIGPFPSAPFFAEGFLEGGFAAHGQAQGRAQPQSYRPPQVVQGQMQGQMQLQGQMQSQGQGQGQMQGQMQEQGQGGGPLKTRATFLEAIAISQRAAMYYTAPYRPPTSTSAPTSIPTTSSTSTSTSATAPTPASASTASASRRGKVAFQEAPSRGSGSSSRAGASSSGSGSGTSGSGTGSGTGSGSVRTAKQEAALLSARQNASVYDLTEVTCTLLAASRSGHYANTVGGGVGGVSGASAGSGGGGGGGGMQEDGPSTGKKPKAKRAKKG